MAKVFIVEPDVDILEIVDVLLTVKGFTVIKASNVKKAIEEIQSVKPDVILLDIQPWAHETRQICKELKSPESPFKQIPLILLSTLAVEYPECQAIDVVSKPFDTNELVEKIKKFTHAS